jgi:cation transport ATPase
MHTLCFQVAAIQRLGLRTAMLTGDCAGAAAAVAAAVALQPADVHAGLLPDDKLAKVGLFVMVAPGPKHPHCA